MNVCNAIVAKRLCIGCGLCAAMCPEHSLNMELDDTGQYVAVRQNENCTHTCGLCLRVCPFFDQSDNEDTLGAKRYGAIENISHRAETGYYLKNFVSYSNVNGHRDNGASGGMATWMLETLLRNKIVDEVLCVGQAKEGRLLAYDRCSEPEAVRRHSRSAYYPVEMRDVIEHILAHDRRYAIIALPCVCKAIRLAMCLNAKLQSRIQYLLGLTCGQTKSVFFAEYICAMGGGDPHHLTEFTCRVKDPNRPASDFGIQFASGGKKLCNKTIFWTEGVEPIWVNRYFTPNPCNFCDDIFAEVADACFMDAWLPGYLSNPKGYNIVLFRNQTLCNLVTEGANGGAIWVKEIPITDVIMSQRGVLCSKRLCLEQRIHLARKLGEFTPRKRMHLCKTTLSFVQKKIADAQFLIARASGPAWHRTDKNLIAFHHELKHEDAYLRRARKLERICQIPQSIMRRLGKSR